MGISDPALISRTGEPGLMAEPEEGAEGSGMRIVVSPNGP